MDTKGKENLILWLNPKRLLPSAENATYTWMRYMQKRGWNITENRDEINDCDIIFFGSDSQLSYEMVDNKKPKILNFWGWMPARLLHGSWRAHYNKQLEMMKKCNMIIVPSAITCYQLCDFSIKSNVCTPGVNNELIDSIPEQEKEYQICSIGRLVPHKNFVVTMRAISMLKKPKPKFIIIGTGDRTDEVAIANKFGIDLEIKEVGDEDKIKELKKSIMYVSSSAYEGYGMASVESVYAGIPTIVSDIPLHREILKNYAIFFNEYKDMAQKIDGIINDDRTKEYFRNECRKYAKYNFTFDKACERLETLLYEFMKFIGRRKRIENIQVTGDMKEYEKIYDSNAENNVGWEEKIKAFGFKYFWHNLYIANELSKIKPQHILDLGCGQQEPVFLATQGYKVTAADISSVVLDQAKQLAGEYGVIDNLDFVKTPAEDLQFEDNSFDCIVCSHLLEHSIDPEKVINEIIRVLKSGGYAIISTPHGHESDEELHINQWFINEFEQFLGEFDKDLFSIEKLQLISNQDGSTNILCILKKK